MHLQPNFGPFLHSLLAIYTEADAAALRKACAESIENSGSASVRLALGPKRIAYDVDFAVMVQTNTRTEKQKYAIRRDDYTVRVRSAEGM